MTSGEFSLFLTFAIGFCAVGGIFALLRVRTRGPSSYLMSAAFIGLGGVLYLLKIGASQTWVVVGGVLVAVLLVADFAVRSGEQANKDAGS